MTDIAQTNIDKPIYALTVVYDEFIMDRMCDCACETVQKDILHDANKQQNVAGDE
jgi:hypothetical protein